MCETFRAGRSGKDICDFFSLRVGANEYLEVMRTTVKTWMDNVARRRGQEDNYVFQKDSAPAHKARVTQTWLYQEVPHHWSPDLWPPSSPDCNPLDYYVWGVLERKVNYRPYNTKEELKTP